MGSIVLRYFSGVPFKDYPNFLKRDNLQILEAIFFIIPVAVFETINVLKLFYFLNLPTVSP